MNLQDMLKHFDPSGGVDISGVVGAVQFPPIDFSYSRKRYKDPANWEWRMNIPQGGRPLGMWAFEVRDLQREYGCLNVCGGESGGDGDGQLGVYVRPGDGTHRPDFCHCWD